MSNIQQNLTNVSQQISQIAKDCGRDPNEIVLLAVSKTKTVEELEQAMLAGQRLFGENYVQEGVEKIQHFKKSTYSTEFEWHFIGPLQSNKSRDVAENFDWIHTVEREKIARRLHEQRPVQLPALNVLIQVNISNESSKSGISETELMALAEQISQYSRLVLRGLMIIPAPENDEEKQREIFAHANMMYQQLKRIYPQVDTLSMGMSDDMKVAILSGSTMVRIGTAIFGKRN